MTVSPAVKEVTIPPEQRILVSEDVAAAMLSRSKPTFRKAVAAGLIERVDDPTSRRNWYRVEDLRRFADSLALTSEVRARAAS